MANRITYKPTDILLSSSLGNIDIETDADYVDVMLVSPKNRVILEERYYAYQRFVTLCNLASLIETEMRLAGQSYAEFTLRVFKDSTTNNPDSCVLKILFCDRFTVNQNLSLFLRENFLTTLPIRRVVPNFSTSIFLFAEEGDSLQYAVNYSFRLKDSKVVLTNRMIDEKNSVAGYTGIHQLDFSLSDLAANAAESSQLDPSEITLLSASIICGDRSLSYFVDRSLNMDELFAFRNCFNCWDFSFFPLQTSAKSSVERSTAVINGVSKFYDYESSKSYEVEVGPLTSDEVEWFDQLITSHEVIRVESDTTNPEDPLLFIPVLITDATCEVNNHDDKPNSVKFTWRYANDRPIVLLSASPSIFTPPFNIVFS